MSPENRDLLLQLLERHRALGIAEQIDYDKFYLYSIIVHSTAIEGSTVTEVEAQLLFDEGITSSKRTLLEQQMNLDLKVAYEYGREWTRLHQPITIDWLILLASKVMARTGSEYSAMGGNFSASKGELRKLNVSAGIGGKSYMSYLKVPERLAAFCEELNNRRKAIDSTDVCAVYDLSFWAHYELVTIHPWADGNGRTSRLLMNLLQMEFGILPTKVLKEDKATYEDMIVAPETVKVKEGIRLFTQKLGEKAAKRAPQADVVVKTVAESRHPYIIVMGDFNDPPVSYPHYVISKHLEDTFAESGFGLGISYHLNHFYFRLDNIMVSPNLQSYKCQVDNTIDDSDHYPISCFVTKKR